MRRDILSDLGEEVAKTEVIVFAGGFGKRMGVDQPKALLEVGGEPLIDRCIDFFTNCGFADFRFLLGYGHERITAHLDGRGLPGMRVGFSVDRTIGSGRGRSLVQALESGEVDPKKRSIIAFPDDIFMDESLPLRMLLEHVHATRTFNSVASLVLTRGRRWPYGVATVDESGLIRQFEEKPFVSKPTSVGLYLFEPEVYKIAMEASSGGRGMFGIEDKLIPRIARDGRLYSIFIPPQTWYPVNTQKDMELVGKVLQEGSPDRDKDRRALQRRKGGEN